MSRLNREAAAIEQLKQHVKYSFLKMVKRVHNCTDCDGKVEEQIYHELAVSSNFQAEDKRRAPNWWGFLFWLAANLFILITHVKFIYLSIVQFKFDSISVKLWPQVSKPAVKCLTLDQFNRLIERHSIDYKRFVDYGESIARLSPTIPSLVAVGSIAYILLCTVGPWLMLFGSLSIRKMRPTFQIYDFMTNKHEERRKFRKEFKSLCEQLFVCERRTANGNGHGNGNSQHQFEYRLRAKSELTDSGRCTFSSSSSSSSSGRPQIEINDTTPNESPESSAEFAFKSSDRLENLFRPAHLSDWLHQRVLIYTSSLVQFRWFISLAPSFVFLFVSILSELNNRVAYRLDSLDCQSRGGIAARAPIRLASIDSSPDFVAAYRAHDPSSFMSAFNLILIEARLHLLTPGVLLTLMEIVAIVICASYQMTFYFGLYAYEYVSKMSWLKQIEQQIRDCLLNLQESIRMSAATRMKSRPVGQERPTGSQRNECLRSLTLAYINYELFRRQQKRYQSLTIFLTMQTFLMEAQGMIVCYLTCAYIKSSQTSLSLALATHVGALLNLFLITGAIRTGKALKLMKSISRILALSAESSLSQAPAVRLWSMQLLTQGATKEWFAPRLLGVTISYDKIITLNAYLLAVWYIALKS